MCYLGIGYPGDAFVDIVQSLSPVRSFTHGLQDASSLVGLAQENGVIAVCQKTRRSSSIPFGQDRDYDHRMRFVIACRGSPFRPRLIGPQRLGSDAVGVLNGNPGFTPYGLDHCFWTTCGAQGCQGWRRRASTELDNDASHLDVASVMCSAT